MIACLKREFLDFFSLSLPNKKWVNSDKFWIWMPSDYSFIQLNKIVNQSIHLWFGTVVSDGADGTFVAKSQTNEFFEKSY